MIRFALYWRFVRDSLWFLPLVMTTAAVLAALAISNADWRFDESPFWTALLYSGDIESARTLLSALLSGTITMTALVISITVVVLTLAAGQLGPRVIRFFIADRSTQFVLGLFVANILYVLMILRSLDEGASHTKFHVAVTGATALSSLSILVLLFFIHRLAQSIMSDHVIGIVDRALLRSIEHLSTTENADDGMKPPSDVTWIELSSSGYLQAIDYEQIVRCAHRNDVQVWADVRPGDFVLAKDKPIAIRSSGNPTEEVVRVVKAAFVVGDGRTEAQDVEYGFRQLVEIALRALSPGINDPYTAVLIIDRLVAALALVFERGEVKSLHSDEAGNVRLSVRPLTYDDLVATAFDPIRAAAAPIPLVLSTLACAIGRLAPYITTDRQREPLVKQLDSIAAAAKAAGWIDADLRNLALQLAESKTRISPGDADA